MFKMKIEYVDGANYQIDMIHHHMKNTMWEDGLKTVYPVPESDPYSLKKNSQCRCNLKAVFNALDNNSEFLAFTYARESTEPMITKTKVGGYYRPHFDAADCGHFSTTIFLNDPQTYDGGELCLMIDNEERKFKLDPGYGITYETGTSHCVNDVTRGERNVMIFWTVSMIRDMNDLHKWRYYDILSERHHEKNPTDQSLFDFQNSLYAHFREKSNKIVRKYL